jgi:ferritin-like metal-binding protein YciE
VVGDGEREVQPMDKKSVVHFAAVIRGYRRRSGGRWDSHTTRPIALAAGHPRAKGLSMKQANFEELFIDQIQDLYDAEKQIVAALPNMQAAASSSELAGAFEEHLEQTKQQVQRLERIFEMMGEQPKAKTCEAMQGLLKEGQQLIEEYSQSAVLDAALIGAAQKVEHYEISGYGTARTTAAMLGQGDAADLLEETLEEEKETDEA